MKMIPMQPAAIARIRGANTMPGLKGTVRFFALPCGVLIEADIFGLPGGGAGFLGFHIHEGTGCTGEGFADTLSHYNPTNQEHPFHAGDLPPLLIAGGRAYLSVLTDRFRVGDVLGRTVVIHSGADDFHTQPAGNAGEKIACGRIIPTGRGCRCGTICSCGKEKVEK